MCLLLQNCFMHLICLTQELAWAIGITANDAVTTNTQISVLAFPGLFILLIAEPKVQHFQLYMVIDSIIRMQLGCDLLI